MNNHRPMSNPTPLPLLYNYPTAAAYAFESDQPHASPIAGNCNAFWSIPTTPVAGEFDSGPFAWSAAGLANGGNDATRNDVSTAQATNFVEQNFSPTFGTVPFPFYQQTSIFPQISSGTFPKINNNSDHCYYQFYDSNNSMSSPYILNHSRSNSAGAGKKRVGGRRPKIENVSPEEEEKRRVRRQRNKEAAARCRKRRFDHMSELSDQVEELKQVQCNLQAQIKQLEAEKRELDLAMQSHQTYCKWRPPAAAIKPPPSAVTAEMIGMMSPPAPTSLNLALTGDDPKLSSSLVESITSPTLVPQRPRTLGIGAGMADVPIETPSGGIPSFKYDAGVCSLLEAGTGWTPTTDTPLKPVLAATCVTLETPTVPDTPSGMKALAQL